MRTFRAVTIGTVAVVVAVTAVSTPASAAAPPAAPYTALSIDGTPTSWWHQGALAYDQVNGSTFTVAANANDQLDFRADRGRDYWTFRLAPPTGATWASGTTYQLAIVPSPDKAFIDVSHGGATCDEAPGTLNVREVTRDAETDALTGFAATFLISCSSSHSDLHGEIRWNSTVDYAAAATDALSHNFGDRLVGGAPVTKTITVTSTGPAAAVFGTARFWTGASAFSITADTCSGTTRSYGETCTMTVSATPTKLGAEWTYLELPDNTALGKRNVQLGINGRDPRTVAISPASLNFADQNIAETGTPRSVTVTGTGDTPITFGAATISGADASSFVVTANTCAGATLAKTQTCRVDVAPKPAGRGARSATLQLANDSLTNPLTVPLNLNGVVGAKGTYYPLAPSRIMDTRTGNGAPRAKLGPNGTVNLQVTGRGGVPSSGVGAVVLNVTVTGPTASSYLTVYPSGLSKPTASSLNFQRGWTRSNSVTVAVGTGGKVAINNFAGSTHVVVDVLGFYASDDTPLFSGWGLGGQLQPVPPERLFDSRSDWGEKLPAGYQVQLAVNYGAEANSRIRALVVNITAVSPASSGFLTAWDGEWPEPSTSTVNYAGGSITPNLAIVPTRYCFDCGWSTEYPTIGVYTLKDTHVIIDIVGFIDDGSLPDGLRFSPRTPTRIVDSRIGRGLPANLGPGRTGTVTTPGAVLIEGTEALALNVTAVKPTASTYLKLWPNGISGIGRPDVSNLNARAGEILANAAVTAIGPTNQFNIYNHMGTTGVVADAVGTFWRYPGTASGPAVQGFAPGTSRSPYVLRGLPTPNIAKK